MPSTQSFSFLCCESQWTESLVGGIGAVRCGGGCGCGYSIFEELPVYLTKLLFFNMPGYLLAGIHVPCMYCTVIVLHILVVFSNPIIRPR